MILCEGSAEISYNYYQSPKIHLGTSIIAVERFEPLWQNKRLGASGSNRLTQPTIQGKPRLNHFGSNILVPKTLTTIDVKAKMPGLFCGVPRRFRGNPEPKPSTHPRASRSGGFAETLSRSPDLSGPRRECQLEGCFEETLSRSPPAVDHSILDTALLVRRQGGFTSHQFLLAAPAHAQ